MQIAGTSSKQISGSTHIDGSARAKAEPGAYEITL